MAKPSSSLKRRLIGAAMAWLMLALAASGTLLRVAFEDSVERAFQLRLATAVRSLAAVLDVMPDGSVSLTRPVGDPRFEQPYSGWYWQMADQGGVLLRSRSLWDTTLPVLPPSEPGAVAFGRAAGPKGEPLLTAERDLSFPERAHPVHVAVAASRHDVDRELARFDRLLLASFVLLAAGLAAAMAVQVSYGLRPLSRLTAELEALKRHAGQRLSGGYPAEIAPLAEAFNTVLDHDAELVARARTHVGNLAHGLKTPLSVLRAELSSGTGDPLVLAQQIDRMDRLIEHQLTRARAEASSARALGTQAPVAEVAAEIAAMLTKIHADRTIAIHNRCDPAARFAGDREDLAELLGNLLENACKWARTQVVVRTDGPTIWVEDDGPGLSERDHAEATRRGVRLDESAPGHGLGLAIVRDLAGLYGGRLELDRSELGGLAARLVFV
ncbi:MAG: sensor histidine kinase [Rhodospirillaceae bacterium]|nr:sensor histidine kinase [Rhodospirillales bacterium]